MNHRIVAIALSIFTSSLLLSCTPEPIAIAPVDKDFDRNETSKKGTVFSPLMPGSLWRVVSPMLNCRIEPGTEKAIVKQFNRGDIIQAEVWRGGADEVLVNPLDGEGKPWMHVRGDRHIKTPSQITRCYVRANGNSINSY